MSDILKISGKKFELSNAAKDAKAAGPWTFSARPGGWIVAERELADGSRERRRLALSERNGKLSASLSGFLYYGELIAASRGGATAGGTDSDLTAQFPGKVRKILVQVGQEVAAGDKLVLVEAMKMEFSVQAPHPGKVKVIHVKENQQLSPGDRFLDIESKK